MKMKCAFFALLAVLPYAVAQQQPDLVGTVSFNVGSTSGRVERIAVTVGDGGTGPYKAILAGDPSLPTHTLYRPRDLSPFGGKNLLPIVAFGSGGCRNSSGEFRNFLSEIASHGYLVVAIGPAGDSVVSGSEGSLAQTKASQLLDGVDWAIQQNGLAGSEYHGKIDTSKIAVMGQSCGTMQATEVSTDPRITTTVLLNGGGKLTSIRPNTSSQAQGNAAQTQAPGAYGSTNTTTSNMFAALDQMAKRYAPYAPATPAGSMMLPASPEAVFHGPVAYINGGPSDIAYTPALGGYEAVTNVPALFAFQDVGHYPATYRQPNGGAFAVAVVAWLDWQLKGDQSASKMFVGANCGLCSDSKWTVRIKNLPN